VKEVEIGEPVLAPHMRPRRETSCSQSHAEVKHAARCFAAHAHDDLCPAAATSHSCEAGGDRTGVILTCMPFPCKHACHGGPRLVGGTMRDCRAQRQHARALPPTLPRPRHGSCARRRTEGVAAAEPLNRFPSRLGECTAPSAPAVHSHFAFELPCRPEAALRPSCAEACFLGKAIRCDYEQFIYWCNASHAPCRRRSG
jgi:hypothetical protein